MAHKLQKTVSTSLLILSFVGFLATCVLYIATKSSTVLFIGVFVCIACIVAGVALGMFVLRSERNARTKELKRISAQHGWKFDPQPREANFLEGVPKSLNAEFLGGILEGKTRNLITGKTEGLDFAVIDQFYVRGVGEDAREAVTNCIVLQDKKLLLPVFRCEPRGWAHTILKFLLSKETMFDGYPKFSRRYRLHGPDEVALRQTFNPSLLTYLEQTMPLTLVGADNYLIVLKEDAVFSPDEIPDRLIKTLELAKLF